MDPAGGGTDAPPYCIDYGGAVVNFSIARHSYASFERLPKGSGVLLYSHDQKKGRPGRFGQGFEIRRPFGSVESLRKRLLSEDDEFLLVTQSDIPQGTGLGGSGTLGVAMLGAIARAQARKMTKEEIALLANEIERKDLGNAAATRIRLAPPWAESS